MDSWGIVLCLTFLLFTSATSNENYGRRINLNQSTIDELKNLYAPNNQELLNQNRNNLYDNMAIQARDLHLADDLKGIVKQNKNSILGHGEQEDTYPTRKDDTNQRNKDIILTNFTRRLRPHTKPGRVNKKVVLNEEIMFYIKRLLKAAAKKYSMKSGTKERLKKDLKSVLTKTFTRLRPAESSDDSSSY